VEVSYTTTLDDYVAYAWHMWRKSKAVRGAYLSGWLFFPALGLLGAAAFFVLGSRVGAGVCVGAAVLYAAIYPAYYRRWTTGYLRAYAKDFGVRGVFGPIRLILSEESLVEITELTRSEARWPEMYGIEEVGDCTFILVTGMSAAILPRHGFEREDDYFTVRDFARADQSSCETRHRRQPATRLTVRY
jgi:YcxB-like protein